METMDYTLDHFIERCRGHVIEEGSPADFVERIAPEMHALLNSDKSFLKPEHCESSPDHYARNAIYIAEDGLLSLYALVWSPGQWTPIHDHGTWGVVGVVEGTLHECNFIRTDDQPKHARTGIELTRGGVILLSSGTVTSFVPNPDHIHITGNPYEDTKIISLHLYGRAMSGFNIYDRLEKTTEWVEVQHNDS